MAPSICNVPATTTVAPVYVLFAVNEVSPAPVFVINPPVPPPNPPSAIKPETVVFVPSRQT